MLADAQTNGGLLASVPEREVPAALARLRSSGVRAAVIGELVRGAAGIDVS
jgi:selenide,water dikinase